MGGQACQKTGGGGVFVYHNAHYGIDKILQVGMGAAEGSKSPVSNDYRTSI